METRSGRVQCRTCHHREAVRPQLKGAKLVNTSRGPNGTQFPSHQISLPNSRVAHHPFPWMLEHISLMFTSHLLPGCLSAARHDHRLSEGCVAFAKVIAAWYDWLFYDADSRKTET